MAGATTGIDLRQYIRPGDTVVIEQSTAEPRALVEALIAQRIELAPLKLIIGASFAGLLRPEHTDAFELVGLGGVGTSAVLTRSGVVDVLPVHLGALPGLFRSGRLRADVALVQLSAPNERGEHSFGLNADYMRAVIERARVTLAEVNPRVPFTFGDTLVPGSSLTATVNDDRPLARVALRPPLPEDDVIAGLVAALIPDGATLQFGVGGTPDAVLARLGEKNDLGVHSGMISDAIVDLVEAGVVTNRAKGIDDGLTVTGALFGTDRLYSWADRNPSLAMRPVTYTHDATVLASVRALFAINSAIEVDLTGQVNGEIAAGQYVGTVGGQPAFARAAALSDSGRAIVALPSTARGGELSRIVGRLSGAVTSTARCDADLVVTEHGVADLRGATLSERRARLLAIADPRHRDALAASDP